MKIPNLLLESDISKILAHFQSEEDGVSIGELVSYDPDVISALMTIWCQRVDKVIKMDKEVNGSHTHYSKIALHYRGFTYEEYAALFNPNISEEKFPDYPVFNQLRRDKGGINFEKQRHYFTSQYEYDKEDYTKILCENGFEPLLSFFLSTRVRLTAFLPHGALMAHTYVGGSTGSGKSVLMTTLFYRLQRKYKKYSLVLIDPHGSLAEAARRFKLNRDQERLIYIDPFFRDGYTPCFNIFQINNTSIKNLTHVVEQNILAFDEILSREGGKITEAMVNMLEKCLYFLLRRPGSNILDLQRLLGAEPDILAEAKAVDSFFDTPYEKYNNKTREGLYFRISRLLNSPVLRNLLVGESTFNLEKAINSNKVIIFNLGGLSEMSQIAVGKMLLSFLKSCVRKRKKEGFLHTFLVADEAHNFVTGSIEYILSQLRGFGLHCIFASQYIDQFEKQAKSVKKNCAVKIVASEDPEELREIIKVPKDATLKRYEFFLKVRYRSLIKFKSPSTLIDNPRRYELSKEELSKLDTYLLNKYYKPIPKEEEPHLTSGFRPLTKKNEEQIHAAEKPPFDLFIDPTSDED